MDYKIQKALNLGLKQKINIEKCWNKIMWKHQ